MGHVGTPGVDVVGDDDIMAESNGKIIHDKFARKFHLQ
jgi:hypothetical protein